MFNRSRSIHPSAAPPRPATRGQTFAEFALPLPLLLLLMFGIVEFGRIFQAWVTIQNAARTAARYAITGQYDQTMFPLAGIASPDDPTPVTGNGWLVSNPSDIFPANPLTPPNTGHGIPCPVNSTPTSFIGGSDDMQQFSGDPTTSDEAYQSHWDGFNCDPTDPTAQGLQTDILRLPSIARQAQLGVSGLNVSATLDIPGTDINSDATGANTKPGWFNVYMCSGRSQFVGSAPNGNPNAQIDSTTGNPQPRYLDQAANQKCLIAEPDPPNYPNLNTAGGSGRNQYDAGGSGDFVHIVIFFNHPLITPIATTSLDGASPLSSQGYIQLEASRSVINEAFRFGKVVNLPGGSFNTYTPTDTFTPTLSLTPSKSSTPTNIPSNTPQPSNTPMPSLTPYPLCQITFGTPTLIDTGSTGNGRLQIPVTNTATAPVMINGGTFFWSNGAKVLEPNMYVSDLQLQGQSIFWEYDTTQPTIPLGSGQALPTPPGEGQPAANGWAHIPPDSVRQFPGNGATTFLEIDFSNTTTDLATTLHGDDFVNTILSFDLGNGSSCTQTLSGPSPTVLPNTPTPNATPNCTAANYSLAFEDFDQFGTVRFQFTNNTATAVAITGFTFQWQSYFGGMALQNVVAGNAANPFLPGLTTVWQGNSSTPPTSGSSGAAPPWQITPEMPNGSEDLWLIFNTSSTLNGLAQDFNGSVLSLDNGCTITTQSFATVLPTITDTPTYTNTPTSTVTNTPSSTLTHTSTPTATKTYTPTQTLTPSMTYTASLTNTSTLTYTASSTRTPSKTPTPTQTYTATKTYTATMTASTTLTPSNTNTFTNTPTATKTFTPSMTFTASSTYTATLTPTNTSTKTPKPTKTQTNTPTQTYTSSPTLTPSLTYTPSKTSTPNPTATNTSSPTKTPTATYTNTPSPTWTPSPTFTPSNTPTPIPSSTPTPSATSTPPPTWTQANQQ